MVPALPSDDVLYAALIARDATYEDRAFVAVRTTGIFCRLTCPARKPRRENCSFFSASTDCLAAGFRPCSRCRPTEALSSPNPIVAHLLARLGEEPDRRWRETDLSALGFDPSTVRRMFKRHLGATFIDISRRHRLKAGYNSLLRGDTVIEAQLDAGFESASGFRSAVARLLGRSPAQLQRGSSPLRAAPVETPIGPMLAVADGTSLHLLEFLDRRALPNELKLLERRLRLAISLGRTTITDQLETELQHYFRGVLPAFETPIALHGGAFAKSVWDELRRIPVGNTISYSCLATILGKHRAARSVARANASNQLSILIPCHRVVGSNGDLTGYGGGFWRKRWLLDHERTMAGAAP